MGKGDANSQDRDVEHDPRFSSTTFQQDPFAHRSPLHYAAELGNILATRQLLAAKADPNIRDSKQETPFHLCISGLRSDDAKLEHGSGVRVHSLKRTELNGQLGSIIGP